MVATWTTTGPPVTPLPAAPALTWPSVTWPSVTWPHTLALRHPPRDASLRLHLSCLSVPTDIPKPCLLTETLGNAFSFWKIPPRLGPGQDEAMLPGALLALRARDGQG